MCIRWFVKYSDYISDAILKQMGRVGIGDFGLDLFRAAIRQTRSQLTETGPLGRFVFPAIQHYCIMVSRATVRLFQTLKIWFVYCFQNLVALPKQTYFKVLSIKIGYFFIEKYLLGLPKVENHKRTSPKEWRHMPRHHSLL